MAVCHRRAGKTVACVNDLIDAAIRCQLPDPRFGYIAPTYTQAKDVAWMYVKRYTATIPGVLINESELRVDMPGGRRIRLYGADNYDRMRGLYFDGVVCDEYGDMDPRAWPEVIRATLSDRRGWGLFLGTPRGRNHFSDIWDAAQADPDWFALMLKASATGILDVAELADARKSMTPAQYSAEYECSFSASLVGAYYGAEMDDALNEGRICNVPHDPAHGVQTWWDLGYDDSTSIWFVQYIGREVRVIDYIEQSGEDIPHYVKELDKRPYRYTDHILPHDAGSKTLASAGKTIQSIMRDLGMRNTKVVPVTEDVLPDINLTRMLIPRCYFDRTKCMRGIEALRSYRKEWDDKNKVFKSRPLHDWASHGADAFRTGAVGGSIPAQPRKGNERGASPGAWLG